MCEKAIVELIMYRYTCPVKSQFNTVKEAAESAIGHLDNDLAFPHSISVKGKIVWKMNNYLEVRKELRELI